LVLRREQCVEALAELRVVSAFAVEPRCTLGLSLGQR